MNDVLLAAGGGLALLFLGVAKLRGALRGTEAANYGDIVYTDSAGAKLLKSHHGFHGRPDAIIRTKPGFLRSPEHRPWEFKTTRVHNEPPFKHVMQLAAEGFLVEAEYGKYPEFGYLEYDGQGVVRVRLGAKMKALCLAVVDSRGCLTGPRKKRRKSLSCSHCRKRNSCPIYS